MLPPICGTTQASARALAVPKLVHLLRGPKRTRRKSQATWLDYNFIGVAEVVLTLREEVSGAMEAAAVLEKGASDVPVRMILKCLEAWALKRTVLVADGQQAIQALMTAVNFLTLSTAVTIGARLF